LSVFLNLAQIRFPIGAIASIAHRVSGVLTRVLLSPSHAIERIRLALLQRSF
jgi:succinate dehydrogenase/fumarate reductase cytochrome b subunit